MEFVTDMGAQARFVWPAYAAFVLVFGALVIWAWATGARAKAALEKLERGRRK